MPLNTTNLIVSLAFLKTQGVARDKVLAASVAAGLIPGLAGLAVPFLVARSSKKPKPHERAPDVPQLSQVPLLLGKKDSEVLPLLKAVGLTLGTTARATIAGGDEKGEGTVVQQTPSSGTLVQGGTSVDLLVSLGPPSTTDGVSDEQQILRLDQRILEKVEAQDAKLDQLLNSAPPNQATDLSR